MGDNPRGCGTGQAKWDKGFKDKTYDGVALVELTKSPVAIINRSENSEIYELWEEIGSLDKWRGLLGYRLKNSRVV